MINANYLENKGLEPYDFLLLQLIAQNKFEDMSEWLQLYLDEKHLQRLLAFNLISTVKKKRKSDHDFTTLRLSKEGRKVWRNAMVPEYTVEDEKLLDYLVEQYKKYDKPVGNREKVKELLSWFRVETGYSRKQIYKAVCIYLRKEMDYQEGKFIRSLEHLLFKGQNVYQVTLKLSDSKLYQFINDNKDILNANKAGKESD